MQKKCLKVDKEKVTEFYLPVFITFENIPLCFLDGIMKLGCQHKDQHFHQKTQKLKELHYQELVSDTLEIIQMYQNKKKK